MSMSLETMAQIQAQEAALASAAAVDPATDEGKALAEENWEEMEQLLREGRIIKEKIVV